MKKRRILKKEYNELIRELRLEKNWVSSRLGEVQTMHERAVSALKKERDDLKTRIRDLERYNMSLDMPDEGFRPEVACQDMMIDPRFEGFLPYIRFTAKSQDYLSGFNPGGLRHVRFRLEVDKRSPPLELNQISMLNHAFTSLVDFIYKKTNNILKGNK